MTSVGLSTFLMTLAMANVLPEPVTPSSVWFLAPDKMPSVSFAMACGWSPAGRKGATSSNMRSEGRSATGDSQRSAFPSGKASFCWNIRLDCFPVKPDSWRHGVTPYQWLVLLVAWLGWVFDSMDSTIYALVLQPALHDLLRSPDGGPVNADVIGWYGG